MQPRPGQIGKVFGLVSAGLSLGGAIMPVPYGMLIDAGRPDLVLVLVAGRWLLSLLFASNARAGLRRACSSAGRVARQQPSANSSKPSAIALSGRAE